VYRQGNSERVAFELCERTEQKQASGEAARGQEAEAVGVTARPTLHGGHFSETLTYQEQRLDELMILKRRVKDSLESGGVYSLCSATQTQIEEI
jgi:hypothetical protein